MRCEPHPISGFIYREVGDGTVRVENPKTGDYGVFRTDGSHVEGGITHADLHLICYIAVGTEYLDGSGSSRAMDVLGGRFPEGIERNVAMYVGDPGTDTPHGKRSSAYIDADFYLDNDRKPEAVPEVYRLVSPMDGGPTRVPTDRFVKREFHDLEVERLWSKVWQLACHVDDIPNVGDYIVYDIAKLSFIIVRTGENEFKAHQNVCLHRGRALVDHDGQNAREFRCPFHGWSWRIDGSLKEITSEWDFPGVAADCGHLPAAKVATWGGFVYINPDVEAMSFEEFIGPVAMKHYESFNLPGRYKSVHATKVMPANWKAAMEAFMEGYHVVATHPQLLLLGADCGDFRYDVFGHWSRGGHLGNGPTSPHRGQVLSKEEALAGYRMRADMARDALREIIGDEAEVYSDAELTDQSFNDLFPNVHPWGGFSEIVFRFRPNGDNHEECIMDCFLITPWPKDKPKPPAARQLFIGEGESWTKCEGMGEIARVLDQDVGNMAAMQKGLKAKNPPYTWYSSYMEGKIRNFHRNYERWLGLPSSFD